MCKGPRQPCLLPEALLHPRVLSHLQPGPWAATRASPRTPASGAAAWSRPRTPTGVAGAPSPPRRPPASRPPPTATAAPTRPSRTPRRPSPSCSGASTRRTRSPPRRGRGRWLVSGPGVRALRWPVSLLAEPRMLCPERCARGRGAFSPAPCRGRASEFHHLGGCLAASWRLWVGKGLVPWEMGCTPNQTQGL